MLLSHTHGCCSHNGMAIPRCCCIWGKSHTPNRCRGRLLQHAEHRLHQEVFPSCLKWCLRPQGEWSSCTWVHTNATFAVAMHLSQYSDLQHAAWGACQVSKPCM